ncbi:MAG: hypothetical protein LBE54_08320 [Brucellaceae bacterium]|jgi:protein-disulfide isomerase|nr:hypothetical protein [Brucellaceae bacterium]
MSAQYPPIEELKLQARRLRQAMNDHGDAISHSTALELIAKQYGIRDWNTLSALAAKISNDTKLPLVIGATISGRYLNQTFTGKILTITERSDGLYEISIHFDKPVDVVTFESFSAFRQRITALVDHTGISPRKTSNGLSQLILDI